MTPLHWFNYSPIALESVLVGATLLLAIFLRTRHLDTVGLSFDESFAMKMVGFSWAEMFERMAQDTHPPMFYILLKLWQQAFGESVIAGRLLSSLLGVVGVGVMYLFVRDAYSRTEATAGERFTEAVLPAVASAIFLALAPLHLYWTLQIRMYSLATLLTLLTSFLLMRALRLDRTRDYCWYTVAAVMLAHTHYYGLFVLATQYLFAFAYRWLQSSGTKTDRLAPIAFSVAALWCACQPWAPYFLHQRAIVNHDFYLQKPSWALTGEEMHRLWVGVTQPISVEAGLVITQVSFVTLLILLLGRRPADYFIATSAAMPVAAAYILSSVSDPIVQARYFLLPHVFLLSAAAVLACRVPRAGRIVAVAALVGGMSFLGLGYARWRENAAELPGMHAAIESFKEISRTEEPLIVSNPMLFTSAVFYLQGQRDIYNYQPPHGFPFYHGTAVMQDQEFVDFQWLQEADYKYVWTLESDRMHIPVPRGWKRLNEEHYREWFGNMWLRLYECPQSILSGN